jgi:monovalent cation/hydrogen antiporter
MHSPYELQVLVLVLAAVLMLTWLARRSRVAPPIVLLVGGVALAFVPWTGVAGLSPQLLLLFLPALLFAEALTTSMRETRANLRLVLLLSIVLVLGTAAAVAAVGHALGLDWPVAWVLGAVIAPTDATAVGALAGRMPHRTLTTLRAESLINDGTALVLYSIAVDVATGERAFSWAGVLGSFGMSFVGGAAVGLLVGRLAIRVRTISDHVLPENGIYVLTPFVAYLLAERLNASGVLSVVVCGLVLVHACPRQGTGWSRLQTRAFWQLTAFLLNGALFVLLGRQLPDALHVLSSYPPWRAVRDTLLISATVIGTRLGLLHTVPCTIRAMRRPKRRRHRENARHQLPMAWSGFRGGVSLAAALAVPVTVADGSPFPGRDLIVVITSGVILTTLLLQGLTLPAVLRWARLPEDGVALGEALRAERAAAEAGLAAMPALATQLHTPAAVLDRVRADHEDHLRSLIRPAAAEHDDAVTRLRGHRSEADRLRAALLAHKRAAIVRLRDSRAIDDVVAHRELARLDAEELRLTPSPAATATE